MPHPPETVAATPSLDSTPRRPREHRRFGAWDHLRLALVVAWLGIAVAGFLAGERPASYDDLRQAIVSGEVSEVRVGGEGLPPGARGYAQVEVRWDALGPDRVATLIESDSRQRNVDAGLDDRGEEYVVVRDVGDRLRSFDPDLTVRVEPEDEASGVTGSMVGIEVSGLVFLAALVPGLATLILLAGQPEPWRATSWAWWWLVVLVPVVGLPLFLLLSGPTPLVRAPYRGAQRLTGGWALIAGCLLAAVLQA